MLTGLYLLSEAIQTTLLKNSLFSNKNYQNIDNCFLYFTILFICGDIEKVYVGFIDFYLLPAKPRKRNTKIIRLIFMLKRCGNLKTYILTRQMKFTKIIFDQFLQIC